ncbi:hypothetical protein [Microbacterium sp. Leaf320]|uniref:hypothetical protein n=1 Tax=Microbacterium sp. Leaf320 TaxID=1736334 RepID=UPI000B2D95F4|nr:hypothetical protein [Microbacterium sp. Leaf320]
MPDAEPTRIILHPGTPVYSERAYYVRRLKRDPHDRQNPSRPFETPPWPTGDVAEILEDAETGLLVTNAPRFERWIAGLTGSNASDG